MSVVPRNGRRDRESIRLLLPERQDRLRLMLSVALALGAAAAGVALLATSGYLISRAAQRPPILMLLVAIVAVRAFGIARSALRYAERLAAHDHALRRLARLRSRLFERLAPLLPARRAGGGEMLSRFVADVDALADAHPRGVIPLLVAASAAPCAGLAAWALLPAAGPLLAASIALPAVALPLLSGSIARSAARRQAPVRAQLTSELIDGIDGAAELAVAGRSGEAMLRLQQHDSDLGRLASRDAAVSAAGTALSGLLAGVGLLATIAIGVAAVHAGQLSGVLLAALVLLSLGTGEVLGPLPEAARRLHACSAAAERVREVLDLEPDVQDADAPLPARSGGALSMEDVRFRYGESEGSVLDGATLQVDEGERVALIGRSGAGKTTIAELLVRFRDPSEGAVTLGGVDVRLLAQEQLREQVLLCGQEAHLFNTTVRENLLLARRSATDEELLAALDAVCLRGWVSELPGGLDAFVGQDGERISGGQRQRLALARALISPARFLILDEPTAHLNRELATEVLSGVLSSSAGRGVLMITHLDGELLSGIDKVLALKRGRITARRPANGRSDGVAITGAAP